VRLQSGDLIAGKYRIESLLGEGGMGAVYVATNEMLRKSVAVKIMNEELIGTDGVQRFFREGVAASRVRHRSVVEVYDAGEHQGAPWMAMELLKGESLEARLERLGTMQPAECVLMVRELLSGIAAAHAEGIVHRDLKPANIFLEQHPDGSVQPKTLDFGIAKLTDLGPRKLTQQGAVVGTASHLSPEQALGEADIDGRADIFALGVVMFEALSGRLPFEDDTVSGMVGKIVNGSATQLRTVAPTIPDPLATVIHHCLARERDARPADAAELSRQLSEALGLGAADRSRLYLTEPSDASARSSLVGETLEDRYRVIKLIGSGGMGEVFEVEHLRIGRRFALKTLRVELATNPEALGRFEREARAAGAIGNEHIVEVSDMGRLPTGEPFIVMEMLEGRDLDAEIAAVGALTIDRAVNIAMQVSRALAAAHDKGIIHRDLKPENVYLLSNRATPDFVKVLDFGISKVRDAMEGLHGGPKTRTGVALGTPHYMAPEQADGLPDIDERVDVYAMGVMLFRMLTGELPYDAPTYTALLLKVAQGPAPPLRPLRGEIPPALEALVQRAMAKDRADRFASMTEMATALSAATSTSAEASAYAATEEDMPALTDDEIARRSGTPTTTERQEPVHYSEEEASVPMSRPLPVGAIIGAVAVLALGIGAVIIAPRLTANSDATSPTEAGRETAAADTAAVTASAAPTAEAAVDDDNTDDADAVESAAPTSQALTATTTKTARTVAATSPTASASASAQPAKSAAPAVAQRQVSVQNRSEAQVRVFFSCAGSDPVGAILPTGNKRSLSVAAVACSASCAGKGQPKCASQLSASQTVFEVH
jgi:serine/threonine protein kinase